MKIDIKDYFMSGHQSDLVDMNGKHVLDNRVVAFRQALKFLLETQFVKLSNHDLHVFMVVIGSGHGCRMFR